MRPHALLFPALIAASLCLPARGPASAQDWDSMKIEAQDLGGGIHMLTDAAGRSGGNIGVCVGQDGVFMIDDKYGPLADKIRAAIATISEEPVKFVLNTHFHPDHTGGNEAFGKGGSVIVAHENVRVRMQTPEFEERIRGKAAPESLPVVTFTESVTFHLNGATIHCFHVEDAHTDTDTIVHFREADVLHTGDVFFNGMYPFIDVASGGSVDGVIAACDRLLAMAKETTKIIPGHGPLTDSKGLTVYRDLLVEVRAAVARLISEGKNRDEVVAAKPTAKWDEVWGKGFMNPDRFTASIFDSLARASK